VVSDRWPVAGAQGSGFGDRGSGVGDRGSGVGDRGSGIADQESRIRGQSKGSGILRPSFPHVLSGNPMWSAAARRRFPKRKQACALQSTAPQPTSRHSPSPIVIPAAVGGNPRLTTDHCPLQCSHSRIVKPSFPHAFGGNPHVTHPKRRPGFPTRQPHDALHHRSGKGKQTDRYPFRWTVFRVSEDGHKGGSCPTTEEY